MLIVVLIILAIAGIFIIVDEAGQASRSDVTKQGLHSQAKRGRLQMDASAVSADKNHGKDLDDQVVGRGNWKNLQSKADEERRKERAMQLHAPAKGRHPRLPRHIDDKSDTDSESEHTESRRFTHVCMFHVYM
jgi:hypothetical protein